jgi:predicted TIM-barrel fold metal-dependent hydrolase
MDRRSFMAMAAAGGAGIHALGPAPDARAMEMVLRDCQELDTLEYFERDHAGRLVLCDGVADRIVDFHTHIGLSFLGSPALDLDREDDEALTYFPARGNAADMNAYSAKSFTEESEKVAQRESVKQAFTKSGFAGTHTPRNLLKEMDDNRVTHSVILAIEMNLGALSKNSNTYMEASQKYPRLIPFVSVHPNDALMERKVRKFHRQGAKGMKIHPPMQFILANNKKCMKLTKLCGELGLPVLFHSGASDIQPRFQDDYCRIEHLKEPVAAQPDTTFILAHGGIYFWKELIELAKANQNVWIELSGQPPANIREMIDAGLEDRMLYGSDWPYYIISLPLAKVLLATDDAPKIREKILYGNAKRLLNTVGVEV